MPEANRIEFKRELTDDLDIEKDLTALLQYLKNRIF